MPPIKPTRFEAPIHDPDFRRGDLKEEAYELLLDYCKKFGYWLLKKPRVWISHESQSAIVEAYIVKKKEVLL